MKYTSLSRRGFLAGAAAGVSSAGQTATPRRAPPSDRINLGVIGVGSRGMWVLENFMRQPDVRVVAVCDCFAERREKAKAFVDKAQSSQDCASYRLHEQILDRRDIDAVLIATGDRWHAVLSVLAARAGKDVYCEKPSTLTIAEGRSMVTALAKLGTVWQCGTQRKSIPSYSFVVDVVRSGRIGKLHLITASMGEGWTSDALAIPATEPPRDVFDYDRWLGQAPWAPYSPQRVRMWRLDWDLSAGAITDMGPHYFEFAQWARGDETSGPVEYEGFGVFRREKKFNTIPGIVDVRARYADGTLLRIDSGPKGVRFDGDEGWIHLLDEGKITGDPKSVLAGLEVPNFSWNVMAPHIRNFLDCMRSRKPTVSPPEVAQRVHTIAHCANLSIRLGRRLYWDPEVELFIGDEQANNMLARSMRAPWRI